MNKLDVPTYNDTAALVALANNARTGSYPNLLPLVAPVLVAYETYQDSFDSPIMAIARPTDAQKSFLLGHFGSPPKCLDFITTMRAESEARECPMCGSLHSGTLDHYLSKNTYPEYAVFSKNLVPACKCNSKRGEKLRGANAKQRILHPYFDSCLADRLVRAQFDDHGEVPRVSLVLTVPPLHPQFSAIWFHVTEVVEKSAVRDYLRRRWIKLIEKPSRVVRAFRKNFAAAADVRTALELELLELDDLHDGKNNWNSMFVAGLLEPTTLAWLSGRLTDGSRKANAKLV